jgi:hypothetical protein
MNAALRSQVIAQLKFPAPDETWLFSQLDALSPDSLDRFSVFAGECAEFLALVSRFRPDLALHFGREVSELFDGWYSLGRSFVNAGLRQRQRMYGLDFVILDTETERRYLGNLVGRAGREVQVERGMWRS